MGIQTITFKKRLRKNSALSALALHVAGTIADLRYEDGLTADQPLALTLADIASACHMARSTIYRYVAECVDAGAIRVQPVYREGKQRASEYLLGDPSGTPTAPRRRREPMTEADRERLANRRRPESEPSDSETRPESEPSDSETDQKTPIPESPGTTQSVTGSDGEYVVTQEVAHDDALPSGGGSERRIREDPANVTADPAPVPAQPQAAAPDADPDLDPVAVERAARGAELVRAAMAAERERNAARRARERERAATERAALAEQDQFRDTEYLADEAAVARAADHLRMAAVSA